MRVLGALCVIAAMVLSTGGVAYRIKADPRAGHAAAPTAPAEAQPESCPADEGAAAKPVVIKLEQLPSAKEFISLNGSGYNYSDPRRAPPIVPEPVSPESGSAESEAGSSPPPASPRSSD